jgi:hypothetical protein
VPGTKIPRVKHVPIGVRNIAYFEDEIDELLNALGKLRRNADPAAREPIERCAKMRAKRDTARSKREARP